MAGSAPEKDKKAIAAIQMWERREVRSGESRLVKAQRAYMPRDTDIDYHEGSE